MESLVVFIVGYVVLIIIIFILLQIIIPLLCTYLKLQKKIITILKEKNCFELDNK